MIRHCLPCSYCFAPTVCNPSNRIFLGHNYCCSCLNQVNSTRKVLHRRGVPRGFKFMLARKGRLFFSCLSCRCCTTPGRAMSGKPRNGSNPRRTPPRLGALTRCENYVICTIGLPQNRTLSWHTTCKIIIFGLKKIEWLSRFDWENDDPNYRQHKRNFDRLVDRDA